MEKFVFRGALAVAVGGAMLATPAQAIDIASASTHSSFAAANPIVQVASLHGGDDYRKDRRKARKKWEKQRYKADKRYWKEQEKRAKYRAKHRYDDDDYYYEPVYRDTRVWRGRDGRVYCRKRDGTTGLIVGGALGALLGREIDTRGDRTLGTILGAAGGAILGREVERGRCR